MVDNGQNLERILKEVNEYPGQKVKLAVSDIDGILRGKLIHKEKFLSILKSGFGFCDVVFGWDAGDVCYDNGSYTGWHSGFPDAKARLDLSTYRRVPWENDLPFFLGDFEDDQGNPLEVCPRNLLKKVRKECVKMGYTALCAQELEWFNFKETSEELYQKEFRDLRPLSKGMFGYSLLRVSKNKEFFHDLFDLLLKFRVPLEGLHTETGPGVYEAAILYDECLESADRAILFKQAVKEIAHPYGIIPTFMAKWNSELPGCGGHIHQSLWDKNRQKNLFFDSEDKHKMSELMKSYVAGQLYCLPHILPMYAPTINSYKRLVEGLWAPTTLTWGIDNRTSTIRVLPQGEKSCRIESRVMGSDVNPYLAFSACLASGLYGIKHNLKLTQAPIKGSAYGQKQVGRLARTLQEATQQMKESPVAVELFGEVFVKHFVETRDWEWRQFSKAVTDWELKRYFEII